jgi:hypothetical protein
MPSKANAGPPHWYAIPVRIALVTFIGTLIAFAVSLFLGIVGIFAIGVAHGIRPDMTLAYRHIALPAATVAGSIIFVLVVGMEIRHYRQIKTLAAIERVS